MTRFDHRGRAPAELNSPKQTRYAFADMKDKVGEGYDDSAKLIEAADEIDQIGGGELVIDRPVLIPANINFPRTVVPVGQGSQRCIIHGGGAQRAWVVRGLPADNPNYDGDAWTLHGLSFDQVHVDMGDASQVNTVDSPRGMFMAFCEGFNSDYLVKFVGEYPQSPSNVNNKAFNGIGLFKCHVRLNDYGAIFRYAGPSSFVTNCILNECRESSLLVDVVALDGISMFITDTYADHSRRFLKTQNAMLGDGEIHINGGGIELCGTDPITGVSYGAGTCYGIENDGVNIYIRGQQFFGGPHTDALYWNKSGVIMLRGDARMDWAANKFARISGGIICVDQGMMFTSPKLWGEGAAGSFHHASSSAGKIIAPRSGFVGRMNFDMGPSAGAPLTNASPLSQAITIGAFDYNERTFECDFQTTVVGTTFNAIRVYLNDGTHVNQIDLLLPNILGGGRLKIVHSPGVELSASALFAPTAYNPQGNAAATPVTKAEYDALAQKFNSEHAYYTRASTVDAAVTTVNRSFQIQTIAPSGSAATIYLRNFSEHITGPKVTGL